MREPIAGLALSNAVRPGVVGWLKTLARELAADGITVNTIAPGRIDTERHAHAVRRGRAVGRALAQIPVGRLGTGAEIGGGRLLPRLRGGRRT